MLLLSIFFSETTGQDSMKVGMIVSWEIPHKLNVGIFDLGNSMAAITKNGTQGSDGSFSHTSPKPEVSTKFGSFNQILTWR